MVPLETNRRVLTWLCVYPANKNDSKWKKSAFIAFSVFVFILIIFDCVASAVYFCKNVSTDFEKSSYAVSQLSAYTSAAYLCIITFLIRHKITALIDGLSDIYKSHANDESLKFLIRANDKSEWMWSFYFKYIMCGTTISVWFQTLATFYSCWKLNDGFDPECVYHFVGISITNGFSFDERLPFDQETTIGYFGEIFIATLFGEAYFIVSAIILFFISMCQHHQAFYQMFKHLLRQLNRPDGNRNDKELLRELIHFHISVKDFFGETSEVFSLFLLVQMMSQLIVLGSAVLNIDLKISNNDSNMSAHLGALYSGCLILFLYCHYGAIATESFENMTYALYDVNWEDLPIELQKFFLIMIGNAQQPLCYDGFGVAILDLELYTRFMRGVQTFYLMFKNFQ